MFSLNQFKEKLRKDLKDFETHVVEIRDMDPDTEQFPNEMSEADWLSAFDDFVNSKEV